MPATRRRAKCRDDADFADAAFDGALSGFELENHAARNDAALDQAFNLLAGDDRENSLPIENAGDVREIDQLISAEIFRAGGGHVVGVDVVQLIVRTQAEARATGRSLSCQRDSMKGAFSPVR